MIGPIHGKRRDCVKFISRLLASSKRIFPPCSSNTQPSVGVLSCINSTSNPTLMGICFLVQKAGNRLPVYYQCLKERWPVKSMAMFFSLQASITSKSRKEPPGCAMALMPWAAAVSTPSRNGKNPSETMRVPMSPPFFRRFPPLPRRVLLWLFCPSGLRAAIRKEIFGDGGK